MPIGPVYCETPAMISGFPAEGLNTWSNLVIIAFGLLAAYIILRRRPRAADLWLLAALLVGNGIGSFLWHGWRTSTFLILDSLPGALFLLVFVYLWLRRFYARTASILALILFFALIAGFSTLGAMLFHWPTFVAFAPVVIAYAALLVYKTRNRSGRAAWLGFSALASALLALVFRTIDLLVCTYFPLGTHFLWHIFLSLAAFLGVLTLLELDKNTDLRSP